jgi:hypothetical protein
VASGRPKDRAVLIVALVIATGALAEREVRAGSACLLRSSTNVPNDIGYRQRGTRCEGVFSVPVSGEISISVIGFHSGEPTYAGSGEVPLAVKGSPRPSDLALRVLARDPQVLFQMDTDAFDGGGIYRWDTAIVRDNRVNLGPDQIAAIACNNGCRHDNTTRFYPVAVGNTPSDDLQLVIRLSAPLSKLYLSGTNAGKAIPRTLVTKNALGGTSVVFDAKGLLLPGDNVVTLIGDAGDGTSVAWWGHLMVPGP